MNDRDTFAAAALTGLLAEGDDGSFSEESYARAAYRWADVMLRERGTCPVTKALPKEKRAEVSYTLTDEEREAVLNAARAYELDGDEEECAKIADTLRKLLERMA